MPRLTVPALWLLAAPALHGATAEPQVLEDYLRGQWYYTEVVIFQRPAVLDHLTEEALTAPPTPLPRTLRAFEAPGTPLWQQYPLYPATRAQLAFPFLDRARLPLAPENGQRETSGGPPADDDDAMTGTSGRGSPPPAIAPRLGPDPLLDFLAAVAEFETSLESRSYRWLESETFTLGNAARRLERSAGYQVLLHGRWLQPVPGREEPESLLIRAADDSGRTLQGTLDVTLGRFLHVQAHLYYREPLLGRAPVNVALAAPGTAAARPALEAWQLEPAGVVQLHHSRRMRSGELHYLDHPKLGVLVIVEPVTPPESLSAALQALQESQQ